MTKEISRRCDMGSQRQLKLLIEEDGDVIVTIIPKGHRLSFEEVEFCLSGTQSPRTTTALHKLYEAMLLDELERPQSYTR